MSSRKKIAKVLTILIAGILITGTALAANDKSNTNITRLDTLIGIIILLAIVYWITSDKNRRKEAEKRWKQMEEEKRQIVEREKNRLIETWRKKFLAYNIEDIATKRNLPSKYIIELWERYGQESFIPIIEMAAVPHITDVEKAIVDYLRKQNFPVEHPEDPARDLEKYLLETTREEAEKIVEKFLKEKEKQEENR
ncbi:hypothetical protein [Desulfurobacterium sp.]